MATEKYVDVENSSCDNDDGVIRTGDSPLLLLLLLVLILTVTIFDRNNEYMRGTYHHHRYWVRRPVAGMEHCAIGLDWRASYNGFLRFRHLCFCFLALRLLQVAGLRDRSKEQVLHGRCQSELG